MQEAQLRLENEDPPTAKIGDVLEYLAFSLYKQGNIKRALALTKKLVQLEPDHPRAKGSLPFLPYYTSTVALSYNAICMQEAIVFMFGIF